MFTDPGNTASIKKKKGEALNQLCCGKKKEEGLILFPLQIQRGMDLEIQSSVRRAEDKQRGTTSVERKGDKQRLYSGYSREQRIKVQEGGD